jgi:hypothetical protein
MEEDLAIKIITKNTLRYKEGTNLLLLPANWLHQEATW